MITDSFFEQGHLHSVCEDYALNGEGYTVISDGCSNGGGPRIHTDFGSRLLAKAAEQHIGENNTSAFLKMVGATAQVQQRLFPNLPPECLAATLMVLRDSHAITVGDGIVGWKEGDQWTVSIIEFLRGGNRNQAAPYYLKYEIFDEVQGYLDAFGGRFKISTYSGELMHPELEVGEEVSPIEERDALYRDKMEFTEEEHSTTRWGEFMLNSSAELNFICSDGVLAFYTPIKNNLQKYNRDIHCLDVLRVLLDIPSFKPGFLQRQCNWAFKQDKTGTFKRRNWLTADDVSVGAVYRG
jgi:hypothetical protein